MVLKSVSISGPQTWVCIRGLLKHGSPSPTPLGSDLGGLGGALEFAFLSSSQVLSIQVQGTHLETFILGGNGAPQLPVLVAP